MTVALAVSLSALAGALVFAIRRPYGLPEVLFALPAAAVLIGTGIEPWRAARSSSRELAPTLAFLALILVFGHLCAQAGVFDYFGGLAAAASGGRPARLLAIVVALAAVVTAALTLDATVVLLTPVVLRSARRIGESTRPHSFACVELANAGSLLLPISNLTNLLAFSASGLSFTRFGLLMALPWVVASGLEWAGLRWYFRGQLRVPDAASSSSLTSRPAAPRYALTVVAATVLALAIASTLHQAPAWGALAGVILLAAGPRKSGRSSIGELVKSASLGFVLFVFGLGIIVNAVSRHGIGSALAHVIPSGSSLPALLAIAFVAALAANLVNNLPATLALTPIVAGHPAAVLAVLIGVNIGPNATYVGSLATLLWRRLLPADEPASAIDFHRYGLISVPVILAATTCALWLVV